MRRLLIVPLVLLAGCGDDTNKPVGPVGPPPPPPPPQTQLQHNINATEVSGVVGYDGEAIKRSVQGTVDAQQKRNAESEAARAAAAGQ
jgi:hypothetical protein